MTTAYYVCHPKTGCRMYGPFGLKSEAERRARRHVREIAERRGVSVQAQRLECQMGDGLPVIAKRKICI